MGIGETFGEAFVKSQLAAGVRLPQGGRAFISVRDGDKLVAVQIARDLIEMGFSLLATRGTAAAIEAAGVPVKPVNKVSEGRPHVVDMLMNDEIDVIINTVSDKQSLADAYAIRREALQHKVTHYTTLAAARSSRSAQGRCSAVSRCLQPSPMCHA